MDYSKKHRFWLITVPIFIAIIITSYVLYKVGTAAQLSLFGRQGQRFGTLAAWMIAGTILIAAINIFMRRYTKIKEFFGNTEKLKQEYQLWFFQHKPLIIDIHLALGIIGFLATLVHAYILWSFTNPWLIITMALFAYIVIVGLALKLAGIPPTAKRYAYLMHSQWITVIVLILVAVVGHMTLQHVRL